MKFKALLTALSLLFLSLPAFSQTPDSLFIEGPPELCLEQCETYTITGWDFPPETFFLWTVSNGISFNSNGPQLEICGYDLATAGGSGGYSIFVEIILPDGGQLFAEGFIFIYELYVPPIVGDALCPPPPPGSTDCHRVCAHATATYSIEQFGEFIEWNVQGAESFEISPNGYQITVTWGDPGHGFIFINTYDGFCLGFQSLCVEILEDPVAAFSTSPPATGDTLTVCEGQTVQFTNASQFASSYEWYLGNGESSTEENPEATYFSPGAYEVSLIAYNDCLCNDTTTLTVIVEDAESPFVDCVSTICENTVQTYSSDATCGTFQWTISPNGVILDGGGFADNFVTIDWGAGPEGTIHLQVSDCSGGDFCLEPAVVQVPIISENAAIGGPDKVCRGETATYSLPAYESTAFTWSVSNYGTIIGGQGTPEVTITWSTFLATAPQWVVVTYENCWLGCGGTDTLTVNMRPAFYAEGAIEVCPGAPATYTARNAQNMNAAPAGWTLIAPDGSTTPIASNTPNPTVSWPDVPGSYQLLAEPAQPDDFCTESYTINVLVVAPPPPAEDIEGEGLICPGGTYTYEAVEAGSGNAFRWTINNGGAVTTQSGNPINVTWGNTPPYGLSVVQISTNGLACESAALDTVLQAIPTLSIQGPVDVCQEDSDLFTTAFYEGITYEWTVTPAGAGTIVTADNQQVEVLWHRPGPATVTLNACGQSDTFTVNILPKPRPIVNHPDNLCPNETTTVLTTTPFTSYTWQDDEGNVVSTQSGPDLGPGYYELIVVDADGCVGDTTFHINGYPESIISISTPDDTGFCPADGDPPRTLYALDTEAGYSYQWFQDGAPIPGETGPTYSTIVFGSYYVAVTDQNGCTFNSNTIILFEFCNFPGVCNGVTCTLPLDCDPGTEIRFDIDPSSVCNVRSYVNQSPNFVPGSLNWDFGDPGSGANNTSTQTSPTHKYSKAGFFTVLLTGLVPDVNGDKFCWDAQVDTVFAAAAFDYDGVCPGGEVQFNDLSTHLPFTSIASWEWNFGDPASGAANTSTDPNPAHVYTNPGIYTVSLMITSSEGCTSNTSRQVEIYPLPDVFFDEPVVSCEGTALHFQAQVPDNVTDVVWDFGDPASAEANVSELFDTYHAFESPGTYTVTLTATSIYGCTNTFSRTLTIEPNGLSGAITLMPPSPICEGDVSTLSAPAGGVSWLWSTGETTESIQVQETGLYSVTVTDSEGCTYEPNAAALEVIPAPYTAVRAVEYNDFLQPVAYFYDGYETCAGEDVFLETETVPGYSYQWSTGETDPETEFSEARGNLLAGGAHDVTLTVTDNSTGCTNDIVFTIVVHDLPAAVQIAGNPSGVLCEGVPATLSVVNPQADLLYVWNTGQNGPSISTTQAGEYSVRAINAFGCEQESNTLTVEAGPDIGKIPSGCHSRCRPDTLCFPDLPDVVSYQWYFNGAPIPGSAGTTPELIAEESGQYYVEMTDNQGCVLTSGPLNLDLFDGFGTIQGNVYFDVNENGVIDAPDTLLSGIEVVLFQNGMLQSSAASDDDGAYAFADILSTDYSLQLDEGTFPEGFSAYQIVQDTALSGCDDLVILDWLLFLDCVENTNETALTLYTCPGATVDYFGDALAAGTTTTYQLTNQLGCDSVVTVTVAAWTLDTTELSFTACAGESVTYDNQTLAAGTATAFTYPDQNGCDSTVIVAVEELTPDTTDVQLSACAGTSVDYQGSTLAAGTTQTFLLTNTQGCDSLVRVEVLALPVETSELLLSACPGEPVEYQGITLTPGTTMDFSFTNQYGCDSTVTVTVEAYAEVDLTLTANSSCAGLSTGELTVSIAAGAGPFRFSFDGVAFTGDDTFLGLPPGAGVLYAEDGNGCITTWDYTIATKESMLVAATDTVLSCDDPQTTVRLDLLSGDPSTVSYVWDDGTQGPERLVTRPGSYFVTVSNECEVLEVPVIVRREREMPFDYLYVPNAFSPNGDGINDAFLPQPGRDVLVDSYRLDIFDRWGNHIFRSDNPGEGWDGRYQGKALHAGVFVWRLAAEVVACGQPEQVEIAGDLVLMR